MPWQARKLRSLAPMPCRLVQYSIAMAFEQALRDGDLDHARAILDELAELPDTGGLWLPECYGDLAQSYDRRGRHDDAIAAQERAIALGGGGGRPDPRSDIAEFHLRAGRADQAAAIWGELKAKDPDDVWLYNAAGLSYNEVGKHELAVAWLGEGLELAMRTEDPEGIAAQLSDVRRRSLHALGLELDELEHRVDGFLPHWRARARKHDPRFDLDEALRDAEPPGDAPLPPGYREGEEIPVAVAWFPAGEYERAIERWADLVEDWAAVPHAEYCRRMDGHIKWMRSHGVAVRAVAPFLVDEYAAWCEEHGEEPEDARAGYAADRFAAGDAIPWPPARNAPCWCGSQRKYKKCCGAAVARPMHDTDA
jgi:tetratricopeptide (TPR) repeat protein